MSFWNNQYNHIIENMLIKLRTFFPDVQYYNNRIEFWYDNGKCLVPPQIVRDSFPSHIDKYTRRMIAGWIIADLSISPPIFLYELKNKFFYPSLKTLSILQLSTMEILFTRNHYNIW